MKITKEDAKKTALLARISLREEESERIANELTKILDYFEKIKTLNTDDVEPMNHILDINNVFRDDDIKESISPQTAVKNAPKKFGSFVVVPKVIDSNE